MSVFFSYGPAFRWFAWHPVRTRDRGWRWLRPVWRRKVWVKQHLPGPHDAGWDNSVTGFSQGSVTQDAIKTEAIHLLKTDPERYFRGESRR